MSDGTDSLISPGPRLLTRFAAELDWEKLLVEGGWKNSGIVEKRRERERERERDREGTEIKLFPSGGSGSLPSFAEKLHKNKIDQMMVVSLSRILAMSIYLLISRTVVGSSRNRSYSL